MARKPKSTVTKAFGRLTWDDKTDWWSGAVEVKPGHRVEIGIIVEDDELAAVLDNAQPALSHIQKHESDVRDAVATRLENDVREWNGDGPIGRHSIANRIRLESIVFQPDGAAELEYSDGDLFWGHSISVQLDDSGSVGDVSIEG